MKPAPATDDSLQESLRRILMLLLTAVWWFLRELPSGDSLFFSPVADGIVIISLAAISWKRGLAWQDGLIWLILSRRIHIDAYDNLEALQPIVLVSWAIWGVVWAVASTERTRYLLLLYHGGLTFDAGMARSFGLGMTVGWEAAPLILMFLSAAIRQVVLRGGETKFPAGAVPVFIGLLFLVTLHRVGPAGYLTCAVVASVSAMILFFATSPADKTRKGGEGAIIALGGIPLCLAAIQMGAADSPSLDIFLRKRLFAGGLHPNIIGVWSLLMLVIAGSRAAWEIVPASIRRVVHACVVTVYALMIFCAGSRVVLLTGMLVGVTALVNDRKRIPESHGLVPMVVTSALALAGWRICQSATIAEWLLNERFFIWSAAWRNIKSALWTGHGILAYGELPQVIDPDAGVWVYDWIYPHTHQMFLEILLWGGLPLMACVAAAFFLWLRDSPPGNAWYAGLSVAIIGLADFVHFTPAMVLVLVTIWFLPGLRTRGTCIGIQPRWRYPVLLLGAAAILVTMNGATAKYYFQNALGAIARGDGSWKQSLAAAADASPMRLDLGLQQMLMELSFGMKPDEKTLARATALQTMRPKYYLPWYIVGRIRELSGSHSAALDAYLKSLELEPRDPMGIRWARAALTARRLGTDAEVYAWRAIQRGVWGAACVLDHSAYGIDFRKSLSERLGKFRATCMMDLVQAHFVAFPLAVRAVPLSEPDISGVKKTEIPAWLWDSRESLGWILASNSIGAEPVVASYSAGIGGYGIARLHALGEMADMLGKDELIDSLEPELRNAWNYRNKNDEDMKLGWLMVRSTGRRKQTGRMLEYLERLDAMDPQNPWILEQRGNACLLLGDARGARGEYEAALRAVPAARCDPFFAAGPREIYAPAGDQWTYAFERAFRRFDGDSARYHAEEWNAFAVRLKERLRFCIDNIR